MSHPTAISNGDKTQPTYSSSMMELQNQALSCDVLLQNENNPKKQPAQVDIGNSNSIVQLPNEYVDPDTVCGFGSFRPQWLQKYATARNYLIIYSVLGVLQGSYFSTLIGSITTLEKRYAFESKISGVITLIDEITPLFLGSAIGYIGGRLHRPRVMAVGMWMSALCCFVSALPYFMYGPSQHLVATSVKNETNGEYCQLNVEREICDEDDRPPTFSAVACLFIGSFLKGFGSLSYYAVGLSYMDDNSKKKDMPLYFATASAFRMFGPLLGYLMSSAFLKYYENPFGDPGYGPEDPRWIGAWWLGFVIQGILITIFTFPLLLFPRHLPARRLKSSRSKSNTENFTQESNVQKIKGMGKALKRLFANPLYILFTLATISATIGGFGLVMMLPKYMELQFRLTASEASLVAGAPSTIAVQVGMFIGGLAIWKWQPSSKKIILSQAVIGANYVISMFILMSLTCQQVNMVGTTLTDAGLDLQNECNVNCSCSTRAFTPVCGPDGISTYFSPCHAGCHIEKHINGTELRNCSCFFGLNGTQLESSSEVHDGLCQREDCSNKATAYIIFHSILEGVTCTVIVGHMMILIRSVDPQDKSIALGMYETLFCAFGFIPYPLIFGAIADEACLIWEESCDQTGNCWFYDIDKFNYLLHGSAALLSFISVIGFSITCTMSSRVGDLYSENADQIKLDKNSPKTKERDEEIDTDI